MFYLDWFEDDAPGYRNLSTSADWDRWLACVIPRTLANEVRRRLRSNLKHILTGLEMKAGLIVPHGRRLAGRSVLFEPYYQIMTFEFCVGVFSVCEGIGSALFLEVQGDDGEAGRRVGPNDWIAALVARFDQTGTLNLETDVRTVKAVRDKIHQDRLGTRADIDWHDFGYDRAFAPAARVLMCILQNCPECADRIPRATNLCDL